jgi:hypothetical protein
MFMVEGQTTCSDIILEPFTELANSSEIILNVAFESDNSGRQLRRLARQTDVLFAFRSCTPRARKACAAAKRSGKLVVWSSDDDLLALDSSNPAGARHERPKIRQATERMIAMADRHWLFSERMRERYKKFRVPTFLSQVAAPQCEMMVEPLSDGTFVVGHIGDYSHEPEMRVLIDAIECLDRMRLEYRWRMEFVGYTPIELENHPNVRSIPYIAGVNNFHAWLQSSGWHLGLAPLRDTRFNQCKTDNKFRTFAAFGIPGIYSNTSPYMESVVDGETGRLVEHTGTDFANAIVELMADSASRNQIRIAANSLCGTKYSRNAVNEGYRDFFARSNWNQSAPFHARTNAA